jgi:hypothetical protein
MIPDEEFAKLARKAAELNQQAQPDPWQDAPTEIQGQPQPRVQHQGQAIATPSPADQIAALTQQLAQYEAYFQSQPTAAQPMNQSVLRSPWLWLAAVSAIVVIGFGACSVPKTKTVATSPAKEGAISSPAPASTTAPMPETVNSGASTVIIHIPSGGYSAAVLAEPSFKEDPANIAGGLSNMQTAELTGVTKDVQVSETEKVSFSQIKWGNGVKWISTCYTLPGGCQSNQPVGDLR